MPALSRALLPRRLTSVVLAISAAAILLYYGSLTSWPQIEGHEGQFPAVSWRWKAVNPLSYDSRRYLKGAPTSSMFDNLLPDQQYISAWMGAGYTNDVMAVANLIYLGKLTDRIPVVPMFSTNGIHFKENEAEGVFGPTVEFGRIFNVSRLAATLKQPILEWHEIKQKNSPHVDVVGCWSPWWTTGSENRPRDSRTPGIIKADISYTPTPGFVKLNDIPQDFHALFWMLAALGFPNIRERALKEQSPHPSPQSQAVLEPNEHFMCLDYVYYASAVETHEWWKDFCPAWNFIGTHMHFIDELADRADAAVAKATGLPTGSKAPPYIAIHVRRADFRAYCQGAGRTEAECFGRLEDYARRVGEVQQELKEKRGMDAGLVIMTSDETDQTWWDEVKALGWHRVDHGQDERYDQWWPVLLDSVVQSHGVGFVGTDMSTMSLLAKRRTEDWARGATRMVKWGFIGADDH